MGKNLNFNHFGGEPSAAAGRGGSNVPLTRQTSIYSLTFDELQNSMGGSIGGKDFGSMNMDDLLKNIWTSEESQALAAAAAAASAGGGLQRQGSLTLPRTLSHKTVDEIWKDMSSRDGAASTSGAAVPQKQPTLGEITLEEFLVRAGVVREDANTNTSTNQTTNGVGFYADSMMPNNNSNNNTAAAVMSSGFGGFGFLQAGLMTNSNSNNRMMMQSSNLPLNVNGVRSAHQQSLAASQPQPLFPKQPGLSYGNPLGFAGGVQLASPRMHGGLVAIADPGLLHNNAGLSMTGAGPAAIAAASGSPAQLSSDGLGESNGDLSSLSPVPYMFNGGVRGRKANGTVEKVVERRQRRMIKNRESAARSRARKQAYTMELEAEVTKLKKENQELQKKQAEIMEMQKNQVLEMMNNQGGAKRQRLRRTLTGPW